MWWLVPALAGTVTDAFCDEALAAGASVWIPVDQELLDQLATSRGFASESWLADGEGLSFTARTSKRWWEVWAERTDDPPHCGADDEGHELVVGGWRLHSAVVKGKRDRLHAKDSEAVFRALLWTLNDRKPAPVAQLILQAPERRATPWSLAQRADVLYDDVEGVRLVRGDAVHGGDPVGGRRLLREVPAGAVFAFEADEAGPIDLEVLAPIDPVPLPVDAAVTVRPADHEGTRGPHARLAFELDAPTEVELTATWSHDVPEHRGVHHPSLSLYDAEGVRGQQVVFVEDGTGVHRGGWSLEPGAYVVVVTESDAFVRETGCIDEPDIGLRPAAWCDEPTDAGGYDVVVTRTDAATESQPTEASDDPVEPGAPEPLPLGNHTLALVPDPPPEEREVAVARGQDVVALLSPAGAPVGYHWEDGEAESRGGCDDTVCRFPRATFDAVSFRMWPADEAMAAEVVVLALPPPAPAATLEPGYLIEDLRLAPVAPLDPRGPLVELVADVPRAGVWKVGAQSAEGDPRVQLEVVDSTVGWAWVPLNSLGSSTYNATWFETEGPGQVTVRLTTTPTSPAQDIAVEVQEETNWPW